MRVALPVTTDRSQLLFGVRTTIFAWVNIQKLSQQWKMHYTMSVRDPVVHVILAETLITILN